MTIYVDPLSGLYNRRYMEYVLNQMKKYTKENAYSIMIGVNVFKSINDNYGHFQGDHAIHMISELLSSSLNRNQLAIRYTGDEFIILYKIAMLLKWKCL